MMGIAYICSRYPFISHTFVLREVEALRALDLDVATFSVHRTPDEHLLSDADRDAAATTYAILPPRPLHLLGATSRAIATRPRTTLTAFVRALRLSRRGVRGLLWQLFYFGEALILWDRCRRAGIRHVHSHFANNASDIGLLAVAIGGSEWRWSFTVHGSTELADVTSHRLRDKIEAAEFVVCTSDFCRSQLMRLVPEVHWEKMRTVHCGVDPSRFRLASRRHRQGESLCVLTVARLVPAKGIHLLLDAVAQLVADGLDVTLAVVGDGPARAALTARAQELGLGARVEFTGFVGQDDILDWYASADVFCLPSFAEGIPVVLMEAMAAELPVVATRIMGIPELVEDGRNGLLVTPARLDELVNALRRLAARSDMRRALGRAGRLTIETGFASPCVARELRAAFGESATSAGPAGSAGTALHATTAGDHA